MAGPWWKGVLTHLDYGCLDRGTQCYLPAQPSVFMWPRRRVSESALHKFWRRALNVFLSYFLFFCFVLLVCVCRFVGMWNMKRAALLLFPSWPASASLHLSTAGFHQFLSCLTTSIHQRTMPAASILVESWSLVLTVWYVGTERAQFMCTNCYQLNYLVMYERNYLQTRCYIFFDYTVEPTPLKQVHQDTWPSPSFILVSPWTGQLFLVLRVPILERFNCSHMLQAEYFPFLCTNSVWNRSSLSEVSMGLMGSPVWPLIMAVSSQAEEMDTADSSL